jgi:hypothetical protein
MSNRGLEASFHPGGLLRRSAGWLAIGVSVALLHTEAHAGECTPPSPECHLKNGKELLDGDPKRAADELLASYKLDERTDTLVLYATALERDKRYAVALETWQRVIVFRESELEAAKENAAKGGKRQRAAARAAMAKSEKGMEQAAEAIMKLWPSVGRVRVRIPAGEQLAVSRGGAEVDPSRDVLVNAGRDELVFTRKDGSTKRVVVEVAAGGSAKVDAPTAEAIAKATPKKADPPRPQKIEQPRPAKVEAPVAAELPKAKPPAEPVVAAEERPSPPLTTVRLAEEPRSRTMSRVGIGLVAGAVVAGGIAGTLGYLADRDYDDAIAGGCSADGQCPFGPAADLAQRSNDRARIAQISAIGAGAMLATGVTLYIVGRGKTRRAATDVTLRVAPSSAAIAWRF